MFVMTATLRPGRGLAASYRAWHKLKVERGGSRASGAGSYLFPIVTPLLGQAATLAAVWLAPETRPRPETDDGAATDCGPPFRRRLLAPYG